jgi:excisionase family DNA binding protein
MSTPPSLSPARATRGSTAPSPASAQAIAVSPREAARLLSIGESRVYSLMRAGELRSYSDGRARRILLESVHDYVARQLATADSIGWRAWRHNPQARASKARG